MRKLTSMEPVLMTTYCVPGTRTQTMDGSLTLVLENSRERDSITRDHHPATQQTLMEL